MRREKQTTTAAEGCELGEGAAMRLALGLGQAAVRRPARLVPRGQQQWAVSVGGRERFGGPPSAPAPGTLVRALGGDATRAWRGEGYDGEAIAQSRLDPGLYVVGTPIGNLGDITLRALDVLERCDVVAAEDTRHSGLLLQRLGLPKKRFVSYHAHSNAGRTAELVRLLKGGQVVALVSDAGMPGISDPGTELVQACVAEGVRVVPVPGPSASLAGLVASGLDTREFTFMGFLPLKGGAREAAVLQASREPRTVVLYERGSRLGKTLADLEAACGPGRRICVGREITKRFEEFWRGTLSEGVKLYPVGELLSDDTVAEQGENETRGEITLSLEGNAEVAEARQKWRRNSDGAMNDSSLILLNDAQLDAEIASLVLKGEGSKDISKALLSRTNVPNKELYRRVVAAKDAQGKHGD